MIYHGQTIGVPWTHERRTCHSLDPSTPYSSLTADVCAQTEQRVSVPEAQGGSAKGTEAQVVINDKPHLYNEELVYKNS